MQIALRQKPLGTSYLMFILLVQSCTHTHAVELNLQDATEQKADIKLLETLRAAWKRCKSDSEFKAHYRYYEGVISNETELSKIQKVGHLNVFTEGFVCKQGQNYRVRQIFSGDPDGRVADLQGRRFVRNMDFDEETDGEIFVSFKPGQGNITSHVQVMKLEKEDKNAGSLPRRGLLGNAITPISPAGGGGSIGFPLEPDPPFQASDFEVMRLKENRIRVRAQRITTDPSFKFTFTIDWNLNHDVPVIERAHILTEKFTNRGAEVSEREVRMSDFCNCKGLLLPSRILFLWKGNFHYADGKPAPHVIERLWISKDLGKEPPQKADFEIPLESETLIVGVKEPIPVRKSGHISVVDLKPEDLLSIGDPAPPGSASTPNSTAPKPQR